MRRIAVGLAILLAIWVLAVACGGDDDGPDAAETSEPTATSPANGEETPEATTGTPAGNAEASAIEALVRAQADANNERDADAFVAAFSDSYYAELNVTRDEARSLVGVFIGVPQVEVTGVSAIEIDGTNATAEVSSNEGVFLSRELYSFVQEGGEWRISAIEELAVDPGERTVVAMQLQEYAFEFDEAQLQGDYAFHVTNGGSIEHEVELMRLPAGVTADDLRDRENVPAGVEVIGLFGPLAIGEERDLVFATPLAAGQYAMVCYLTTTPTGQSNASLGMVRSLTVD